MGEGTVRAIVGGVMVFVIMGVMFVLFQMFPVFASPQVAEVLPDQKKVVDPGTSVVVSAKIVLGCPPGEMPHSLTDYGLFFCAPSELGNSILIDSPLVWIAKSGEQRILRFVDDAAVAYRFLISTKDFSVLDNADKSPFPFGAFSMESLDEIKSNLKGALEVDDVQIEQSEPGVFSMVTTKAVGDGSESTLHFVHTDHGIYNVLISSALENEEDLRLINRNLTYSRI